MIEVVYLKYVYIYIRGSKPKNYIWKWQKYELQMSDDSQFEFYDLWENGTIYILAYSKNGFSTTNVYRNNKLGTFPQKCLQGLYFIFCHDYFQMNVLEWKFMNLDKKFIKVCSQGFNWQYSTGLDNGLAPIRRQAIIWTNDN